MQLLNRNWLSLASIRVLSPSCWGGHEDQEEELEEGGGGGSTTAGHRKHSQAAEPLCCTCSSGLSTLCQGGGENCEGRGVAQSLAKGSMLRKTKLSFLYI